jgi:hypothetical protein
MSSTFKNFICHDDTKAQIKRVIHEALAMSFIIYIKIQRRDVSRISIKYLAISWIQPKHHPVFGCSVSTIAFIFQTHVLLRAFAGIAY